MGTYMKVKKRNEDMYLGRYIKEFYWDEGLRRRRRRRRSEDKD